MNNFFDDLEKQLEAAARAQTDAGRAQEAEQPARPSRWAWLLAGARAAPVLIAVVTTLVIAGAALVAFGHGKHHSAPTAATHRSSATRSPFMHNPNLRREVAYLSRSMSKVFQLPACRPPIPHGTSYVNGSPGQDLLSILGVLRRPAASTDAAAARFVLGDSAIYRGYVRRALVANGVSYFIAATRDSFGFAPSARCIGLEVAALRRELPQIPSSLRAPTLKLQARIVTSQRQLARAAPTSAICFGAAKRNGVDQMCGLTALGIQHGIAPTENRGTFSSVVPDGVASVTVRYRTARGREVSLTGRVSGNMYAVHGPQDFGSSPLVTVVWRSATGTVVKTIKQPSPAILAQECERHPHRCPALHSASVTTSSVSGVQVGKVSAAPSVSGTP